MDRYYSIGIGIGANTIDISKYQFGYLTWQTTYYRNLYEQILILSNES